MKNLLRNIRNTLNKVEVRGAENLDRQLACIQGLDRAIAALEEQEAKANENRNEPKQNVSGQLD